MLNSWRSRTRSDKNQRREEPWLASSLRPENFIPGLIFGFLLGLFAVLPTRGRGAAKGKSHSFPPKRGSSVSTTGEELKMVLVVRQDLKMGVGKIASQCAHAASGLYAELTKSQQHLLRQWENCGQPKIVVSCKNMQDMNKLKNAAENIGLPTFVVADAGRTQVLAGSKTVLAIGPGLAAALCLDDFSFEDVNLTFLLFEQVERIWWTLLPENFAYFDAMVDMTGG